MATKSSIEWADATWNPVRGCTKISPGCKYCYAERFAERFRGVEGHPFQQGFDLRLVPHKLSEPLRWSEPRMVFVNSMSDLFHEGVPTAYIEKVAAHITGMTQPKVSQVRRYKLQNISLERLTAPMLPLSCVKKGATVHNIDGSRFLRIPVPLPPASLQGQFALHMQRALAMKTQMKELGRRIETLFSTLLNRAFAGDLTARWREAHMKELLAEMEAQAKLLETAR